MMMILLKNGLNVIIFCSVVINVALRVAKSELVILLCAVDILCKACE